MNFIYTKNQFINGIKIDAKSENIFVIVIEVNYK